MTKIAVILCYFGKLPENFSLFAESCRRNATIDFLLFTDDTPTHLPENMHLHPTTFAALQRRVAGCFDFAITLHTPYKLCDYKPAYGEIFAPELSGYDFWGYGDMDLVFGDLRAYFTEDKLRKYDKFYAFGHLSLYRNTPENNAVYRQPVGMDYRKAFTTREIAVFDEINGISAKYKALGLPFYDRQDYADITKASDRLAITDVGITADNQLHPNYTEQIFYCDRGRVFRDAYCNGQWLTDEFVYIHISSRRLPLHIDPAADTYFIGKTGYEPKTGATTRADIARYNALDPAADKSSAAIGSGWICAAKSKKVLSV